MSEKFNTSLTRALMAGLVASSLAMLPLSPSLAQGYGDHGPGARVFPVSTSSLTSAGGEVILKTESAVVAGRPQFKYLPGSNGDTVLTADFEGLSWNYPTKIIRLNSSEKGLSNSSFKGIKEIHIGQFQISPSILRVSFIARDPALLKKVAIGAAPGVLKLSWITPPSANLASANLASANQTSANPTSAIASLSGPALAPRRALSRSEMPPIAGGEDVRSKAKSDNKQESKAEPKSLSKLEAKSNAKSETETSSEGDSRSESRAAKGWLARFKTKTKDYFSAPADDSPKTEILKNRQPADVITQTSPAAARAARSTNNARSTNAASSFSNSSAFSNSNPNPQSTASRSAVASESDLMPAVAPSIKTGLAASSGFKSASGIWNANSDKPGTRGGVKNSHTDTLTSYASGSTSSIGPGGKIYNTNSTVTTDSSLPGESVSTTSSSVTSVTEPEVVLGPPPLITLETADGQGSGAKMEIFRVERPDGKALNFKSFRLHNPERYVVDMPDCRELANSTLPEIEASPLVSSMRVGQPEMEGAGRLVLQLTDDTVSVDESFNSGSSYMTVTLAKGLTGNAGIARNGSSVSTSASALSIPTGPILVPRAPSETVVVLDAGHGGSDPGAVRGDVQEKEVTMQIIAKLKKTLESKGARIVLTRSDDTFVSLEDRVKITNTVSPNLFLSVHINSLESTSNIYGIETYFQTDQSRPLANRVHASLVAGLGAPDRSVRKARFYVINHTPIPAILAEVGYITNKAERDRLISSDYQQKVASALARGVMLYLQDVKSQSNFANSSADSVDTSGQFARPSKLATGSWKSTK